MLLVALALTLAISGAPARAEAATVNSATAVRVSGDVSEDVWRSAPASDAFVQREPHDAGQPSQRTEVRVVYDATTRSSRSAPSTPSPTGSSAISRAAISIRRATGSGC